MIFISSSCVGARVYEQLNLQFNNPFCWCRISYKDFMFLVNNLHNIDFNNIKVDVIHDPRKEDAKNQVGLIQIDNNVNILYPHYIQNEKYKVPTKIDINVYSDKINEYVIDKYTKRLSRMNLNDKIYIILCQNTDRKNFDVYKEDCKDFIHKKIPYHKILVTTDTSLLLETNADTDIIISKPHESTGSIAKKIISLVDFNK